MKDIKVLQSDFLISPVRYYQADSNKPFQSLRFCDTWPPLAIRLFAPDRILFEESGTPETVNLKINLSIEHYLARQNERQYLFVREIPNQLHRVKSHTLIKYANSMFVDIVPAPNQLEIAAGAPICDIEVIRSTCSWKMR